MSNSRRKCHGQRIHCSPVPLRTTKLKEAAAAAEQHCCWQLQTNNNFRVAHTKEVVMIRVPASLSSNDNCIRGEDASSLMVDLGGMGRAQFPHTEA